MSGIEKDVNGKANVLRADIRSEAGQTLGGRYGVHFVPTLILLSAATRREVWRHEGFPDRTQTVARIIAEVSSP